MSKIALSHSQRWSPKTKNCDTASSAFDSKLMDVAPQRDEFCRLTAPPLPSPTCGDRKPQLPKFVCTGDLHMKII